MDPTFGEHIGNQVYKICFKEVFGKNVKKVGSSEEKAFD